MLMDKPLPFIKNYIDALDEALQSHHPQAKLSSTQKGWLSFCCLAIALTNSVCWAKFSRCSLGNYASKALCWMFRYSKIHWEALLLHSTRVIVKQYGITQGVLVLDDSEKKRAKSTKRIFKAHKIKDKKSGGYINGQSILILLLVTPSISIPVGFAFYMPDPQLSAWYKRNECLKKKGVAAKERPAKPPKNQEYPTKQELALQLLEEFATNFAYLKVPCIVADALYGTKSFIQPASKLFGGVQVISQLKYNQKVFFQGKERSLEAFFRIQPPVATTVSIRGKSVSCLLGSARLHLCAQGKKCFVIALKYEGEEQYRYLVASDVSWRTQDIVAAFSLRWLVEVFLQDWKSFEGWGQLTKQFDEDGSRRSLILSLLLDHCLLFHPDQLAQLENKLPAYTVGSLLEKVKAQSLLHFIEGLLTSEQPQEALNSLEQSIQKTFQLRHSKKHMRNRNFGKLTPSQSLKYKAKQIIDSLQELEAAM